MTISRAEQASTIQAQTRSDRLDMVQILRAAAAIMVVVLHAQTLIALLLPAGTVAPEFRAFGLGFGVDLFFVISGFIMVYASERLFGQPGGPRTFILRRLIRIVPLYWLALVARMVVLAALAWAGKTEFPGVTAIVTSFLFIPYDGMGYGDTFPFPILDLGWTLNYEMFFYLVFAVLILVSRNAAVLGATVFFVVIAVLGTALSPENVMLRFWSQPIVLEFAAGALVAYAYRRGVTLPKYAPWVAVPVAVVWLVTFSTAWAQAQGGFVSEEWFTGPIGPGQYSWLRAWGSGVPAALLLAAFTLPRFGAVEGRGRILVALGDSSYALYLCHPFVFGVLRLVIRPFVGPFWAHPVVFWVAVAAITLVSIVVAHVIHRLVERPITEVLTRLVFQPRPRGVPVRET